MAVITLPEITIQGSADSQPVNAADWFADGFIAGFNASTVTPERPLMINDDLAGNFFQGVSVGQSAAVELASEFARKFADQPQVSVDVGGETLEKAQEDFREAFEGLFHQHMPHTETESETLDPLPTPTISLVE